uniref:Tubulin domain-containing protein n=1 Tax=Heterorhabditis bacteriophora TaxID=37862 RepID=A0A1I7XB05_HETBA
MKINIMIEGIYRANGGTMWTVNDNSVESLCDVEYV